MLRAAKPLRASPSASTTATDQFASLGQEVSNIATANYALTQQNAR